MKHFNLIYQVNLVSHLNLMSRLNSLYNMELGSVMLNKAHGTHICQNNDAAHEQHQICTHARGSLYSTDNGMDVIAFNVLFYLN